MENPTYTADTLRFAVLLPPPAPRKTLRSLEELDRELSTPAEVDPLYLSYEVRSIY